MEKKSKILILGSRGLVGSALVRTLANSGFSNLLTPVREDLDLMLQSKVEEYFEENKPDFVFMAA